MKGIRAKGRNGRRPGPWIAGGALVLAIALGVAVVPRAGAGPVPQEVTEPPASQPTQQSDAELIRMIEEAVRQAHEAKKKEGADKSQEKKPATPQPATQPAGAKGCGDTSNRRLIPPPADQPQPKVTCDKPELEKAACWRGPSIEFVFSVRNEGQGALDIHLLKP
ncbi:MAG: hypothetical protein PVJ57_17390 [Phycisphaerae bacterium]|jgi:hypothetical protein